VHKPKKVADLFFIFSQRGRWEKKKADKFIFSATAIKRWQGFSRKK
jgi:hypothetical protein